ncbi:hypothetical protein SHLO109777_11415 [Shewanella loihica]
MRVFQTYYLINEYCKYVILKPFIYTEMRKRAQIQDENRSKPL